MDLLRRHANSILFTLLAASGCGSSGGDDRSSAGSCDPVGDAAEWLAAVEDATTAFKCASMPAELPLGDGRGFVLSAAGSAPDAELSATFAIWGGKRFYADGDRTLVTNLMLDSGSERYDALVYEADSILDGAPAVIVDYRGDDSANVYGEPATPTQVLVDQLVRGVRDEIRELYQGGEGTGVYVGRTNLLRRFLEGEREQADDEEFSDPSAYLYVGGFGLDFRAGEISLEPSGEFPSVRVETDVDAEPDSVYTLLTSVDLPQRIFVDTSFLPGVANSEILSESWGEVGSQRRIVFNDQTTLLEETTTIDPPGEWSYDLSEFTNIVGSMSRNGTGSWQFEPIDTGTHVTLTYAFEPIDAASRPALVAFLELQLRGYLTAALQNFKTLAEL